MTTVFNKIHRLKGQAGWTWDRFLGEIDKITPSGLNEKTLYSHFHQPHKKPNGHVTGIINRLHDQCFPNPFPEEVNRLMRLYNNLFKCKKHRTVEKDIEDLEYFLVEQLRLEDERDHLRRARFNWLLGSIHFDRIPTYRDNGLRDALATEKRIAIMYYEAGVSAIEQNNKHPSQVKVGAQHLYKARHNILACYLNAVPQEQRSSDPSILQYLRESNFILNSKKTLEEEPFQWGVARNGVRFSSLVKNAGDVKYFFNALVAVSDRFLDLTYAPLNTGAIINGADFQWAINNVLTSSYLENMKTEDYTG
ncbi:MAG: hypothetical protein P8166_06210 [Candidatus Thiodiazotropha sp.]